MGRSIRILHVDDDAEFGELTAEFLEREDERFEVITEQTAEAALRRLTDEREEIDCIVSDYQMPGTDGIEFLQTFRRQFPDASVPFILLTGEGNETVAADALNAGASSYIQKGTSETFEYVAERIKHDIRTARAERDSDRFKTLLQALDDPVYILDTDGRFTYVNEAFLDLVGYDRREIIGSKPSIIKDPDAVATGERKLGEILSEAGPDSVTFEVEIQPKEGAPVPCEDHMGVLPYEGERFQGSLGVLRDISERKERERTLAKAKQRYQLLVEQNLVGIYIARNETIIYHNEPFAELFGYRSTANELVEESLLELVEPADRDRLAENLRQVEGGDAESIRQPYIAVTPDGETINVELLGRGIELEGEPAVIGTVVDVGKEEEQYWQLRRERDRLEEFTSIVSHDLRNPLNVARGYVELAQADFEGEELAEAVSALDRMEELLEDLLRLARQGETVDERETVGLRGVAESTWQNVATDGAQIEITASGTVHADPSRIKELFENLYRNSVEHSSTNSRTKSDDTGRASSSEPPVADAPGDSVEHSSTSNRPEAEGDDEDEVSSVVVRVGDLEDGFYVEDDGPGIPPEDRNQVFESGYTTAEQGTGFGLAIVEEIVEAHGWQITVTDGRDGGARFEIRDDERTVRVTEPGTNRPPTTD
ncbi:MAG: PAS domain S-box protein [Natronomonas sp.]